jgi:hypothetical protein
MGARIVSLLEARGALCVATSPTGAAKSIRRLVDRGMVRLSTAKAFENALVELTGDASRDEKGSRTPRHRML